MPFYSTSNLAVTVLQVIQFESVSRFCPTGWLLVVGNSVFRETVNAAHIKRTTTTQSIIFNSPPVLQLNPFEAFFHVNNLRTCLGRFASRHKIMNEWISLQNVLSC